MGREAGLAETNYEELTMTKAPLQDGDNTSDQEQEQKEEQDASEVNFLCSQEFLELEWKC
jgi:hypothetical protein